MWVLKKSNWQPIAGPISQQILGVYSITSAKLSDGTTPYVYCAATLTVGVACSKNGIVPGTSIGKDSIRDLFTAAPEITVATVRGITALAIDSANSNVLLHAFGADGYAYPQSLVSTGVAAWAANEQTIPRGSEVFVLRIHGRLGIAGVWAHKVMDSETEGATQPFMFRQMVATDRTTLEIKVEGKPAIVYDSTIDTANKAVCAPSTQTVSEFFAAFQVNGIGAKFAMSEDLRLVTQIGTSGTGFHVGATYGQDKITRTRFG